MLYALRRSRRGARLRRCGPRLRHAARRGRAAERARARHRVRDGVQRARDVGGLSRARRACSTRAAATTSGCWSRASSRSASCSRRSRFRSALDARWTSAAWAIEGAAIVWAGVRPAARARARVRPAAAGRRRRRVPARAVAVGAGAARRRRSRSPTAPSSGRCSSRSPACSPRGCCERQRDRIPGERAAVAPVVFAWGMLWWLLRRLARDRPLRARGRARFRRWSRCSPRRRSRSSLLEARLPGRSRASRRCCCCRPCSWLAVVAIGARHVAGDHLFAHGGYVAWPFAVVDRRRAAAAVRPAATSDAAARDAVRSSRWHAGLFWLVLLLVAHELAWVGGRIDATGMACGRVVPWGLVPALGLGASASSRTGRRWPIGAHRRGYLVAGRGSGGGAARAVVDRRQRARRRRSVAAAVCAAAQSARSHAGDRAGRAGDVGGARPARASPASSPRCRGARSSAMLCALAFLWINAIALRTIHFWYDVPYTPHALWRSTLVQAVLSLLWSTLALATMALRQPPAVARCLDRRRGAARRRRRQAVPGRARAGRDHHAHRVVHRRRPAAAPDRLSRAGSAPRKEDTP